MSYIPKTDDYLKIQTDNKVKDFVVINFGEYFKFMKDKLFFKLCEEENIIKVAQLLYIFKTTPELQMIDTKTMIKNNLKELLSKLKKF